MLNDYEILIVGAGPAGISMAVEARFAGITKDRVLIIEKTKRHSDTIHIHYPDDKLVTANYKGFNDIHGGIMRINDKPKPDTLDYFDGVIDINDLNINYEESVKSIKRDDHGWFIVTTDKADYRARVCVIAIGILGKPNQPEYKLPRTLKRKLHFNTFAPEITLSDVLVVGGGDTASERVAHLVRLKNNVTLSYRGADFTRMNDVNRAEIFKLESENKIKVLLDNKIAEVKRAGKGMAVSFENDKHDPMTFDHIVYCLGGSTPDAFLKDAGIELDGAMPKLLDGYETNVPGLFLAGDLTAGRTGGSINWAFNTSHKAMQKIVDEYLGDVVGGG